MKRFVFINILLAFVILNTSSFGQTVDERVETLEQKILDLEQRIKDLERLLKLSAATEETPVKMGDCTKVQNWRKLKLGMPMDDIRLLLGEPHTVGRGSFGTMWFYDSGFGLGFVSFSEEGLVKRWMEP
jgi:hypothetical protein